MSHNTDQTAFSKSIVISVTLGVAGHISSTVWKTYNEWYKYALKSYFITLHIEYLYIVLLLYCIILHYIMIIHYMVLYLCVVFLFPSRHYNEQQWHLLGVIVTSDKGIYTDQLLKWLSTEIERTIDVPCFRPSIFQLFLRSKYQMPSTADVDITSQETIWDVVFIQFKLKSFGVFRA